MFMTNVPDIQLLEQRIAELEAENAHLRNAAEAFGELAERLNTRLRFQRPGHAEYRSSDRKDADRRFA
jgi:hypothetical protein